MRLLFLLGLVLSRTINDVYSQRIFTSISAQSIEVSAFSGKQNQFGCGQIITPALSTLTLDVGEGSAAYSDNPATPLATGVACGNGKVQCPRYFVVGSAVGNPAFSLYIHGCHVSTRGPVSPSSVIADTIPATPVCGYTPAVPGAVLPTCPACTSSANPPAPANCVTCMNNRVRCFDDCDPIMTALSDSPGSPTTLGSYCESATSPSPLCQSCSGVNPAVPTWTANPTAQSPDEGSGQFYYITDNRMYEYTIINESPGTVTVGTYPAAAPAPAQATYPTFINSAQTDANTIQTGKSRTAICYRGRFYWQ